jgi:hypothetical protein
MPNGNSPVYNSPITVSSPETVAAIAVADSYSVSALATATYTINLPAAATPTFSIGSGSYNSAQTVSISDTTPNATIYYTTNENTPTANSTRYTSAITVSASETIEAIAVVSGYANSSVASATYTINLPSPAFTVAVLPTSLTVTSGSQGSATLTVTPQNGFNSTVSFACSGLPANATCSFAPAAVTPSGAAVTTQLTIALSAKASVVQSGSRPFLPATGLAVAVCFFVSKRRRILGGTLFAVLFAGATLLVGCGGSGVGGGGSQQSYTVTVTATSGTIQQTSAVSLTVN